MRTVEEFSTFMAFIKRAYAGEVVLHATSDDLNEILARYPRMVVAMNHGPMAGPIAGSIAMMDQYRRNGGGHRRPIIIAWRGFYRIPVLRHLVRYVSQVKNPLNLEGFAQKITEGGFTDLFVMPEGENCNYGNGLDIEPFLSPRFIELALKADTPILVAVHRGSERWSNVIPVSDRFDGLLKNLPPKSFARIQASRRINVGTLRLTKIPKLQVSFKLYQPTMSKEDLNAPDAMQKLEIESQAVRNIMQTMVDSMSDTADFPAYA